MELQIKEPQVQSIEIQNFEELKAELTESLKKYENLSYTEDQLSMAKKDRAKLNAFKNALDDRRKEIKKQCLEPYEAFEVQAKELIAMVNEPIKAIDTQIKDYESIKKQEKREAIQQYFDDAVGDLFQILTLDKIFNDKWLNTSTSMASIKKDINEAIQKVQNELLVIGSYESEFVPMMRAHYMEHLDLSAAIQEAKRLESIKKADEEQNPKEESPKQPEPQEQQEQKTEPKEEKIYSIVFEVHGTYDEIMSLKAYLEANKLDYRRVKK